MKSARNSERGSGRTLFALVLLVIVVVAVYFISTRNSSVQNAYSSFKESTQDAATTSRVRTALLLSKQVSPFDVKVQTIQGEVTLKGQVPSEQVKTVAGAIAQDTSSVKQVHNNLSLNASTERNPDREHLGERVADLGLTDNLSVTDAQAEPESADDRLARRVEFALYSTKAIPLKAVQIHADNGVVTLTGMVLSRAKKLLAENTAKSVEGVRRVVNSLAAPEET